jgi:hypothetical protein
MAHLRRVQDIADRNGGTRQTGTPGYSASVDYVVKALKDKGFDVQTPEFELGIFHVDAESLTVDGAQVAARKVEYTGFVIQAGAGASARRSIAHWLLKKACDTPAFGTIPSKP